MIRRVLLSIGMVAVLVLGASMFSAAQEPSTEEIEDQLEQVEAQVDSLIDDLASSGGEISDAVSLEGFSLQQERGALCRELPDGNSVKDELC